MSSLVMVTQSLVQQKKVVAALKRQSCFEKISKVHLSMLATVAKKRYFNRYTVLYREGAAAPSFFVLIRGTLLCESHGSRCETLKVGEGGEFICFGTEAVAGGMQRTSDAMCSDYCEVLRFDLQRSGRIDATGIEELTRRAFAMFVEEELKKMPLFFDLSIEHTSEVADMVELREFGAAGVTIYSPGMPANEVYILAKGRVVLEDYDGTVLDKLTAGSVTDGYPFLGQEALLKGGIRQGSAITRTPCKLLVIRKVHFSRISKLMPKLAAKLQEFAEVRRSRADLARQVLEAKKQRSTFERKAELRKTGMAANDIEAECQIAAAECITRHARGTLVLRHRSLQDMT